MASHIAIASASEAIVRLLRTSYDPVDFNGPRLSFKVYVTEDFRDPMDQGVSVFVYRVYFNEAHRTPSGRLLTNGRRQRARLPIDIHFLITAWGRSATLQLEIAGWMMRILEDHPILPSGLLNAFHPGVFRPDESVEIVPAQLSVDDMFHIWDVMIQEKYQLSVPYMSRMIEIESRLEAGAIDPIRERVGEYNST